jgi:hypothetical protein
MHRIIKNCYISIGRINLNMHLQNLATNHLYYRHIIHQSSNRIVLEEFI